MHTRETADDGREAIERIDRLRQLRRIESRAKGATLNLRAKNRWTEADSDE